MADKHAGDVVEPTVSTPNISVGSFSGLDYDPALYYDYDEDGNPVPGSDTLRALRADGDVKVLTGSVMNVADPPTAGTEVLRLEDLTTGIGDVTIQEGYSLFFVGPGSTLVELNFDGTAFKIYIEGILVQEWSI